MGSDASVGGVVVLVCSCIGICCVIGGFMVRGLLVVNQERLLRSEAGAARAGRAMDPTKLRTASPLLNVARHMSSMQWGFPSDLRPTAPTPPLASARCGQRLAKEGGGGSETKVGLLSGLLAR